ncbi:MAG: hypothetical protein QNJ74_21625 [Trichodesmium sp. MO_231.B1]|nr:hypothetical protein [Trichodesmium sp. MO_231.B1]
MNIDEMKSKINEIRSELNNFNYDNFADKNRKSFNPEKLTNSFSSLLDQLEQLATEASSKFPDSQVYSLFEKGKKLLDVRKRLVLSEDLETGKDFFLQSINIIEENFEGKKKQPEDAFINSFGEKSKSENKTFISFYDEEVLRQIKTVFGMLGVLAPEMHNLPTLARSQSSKLKTINTRINEIRSQCSSAIICLPRQNLQQKSIRSLAYIDLGACLALFPKQTILIYQGNKLPEYLKSNVEVFQYLGNLDFDTGMELARQILKVLRKD